MKQHYLNSEEVPIETLFLFPMDVQVALSKITVTFTSLVDGKQLSSFETVIDERQKAEVRYEDAVASGTKTAVLGTLTKTQRDMMRVSIGNFPAQSEALLTVYFYQ